MVEIVALGSTDNLTLIGGATQYWRDARVGDGWEEAVARHAQGRTLVIGHVSAELLGHLAARADEVHVLTRGIPDAVEMGEAFPDGTIWCGDPRDLSNHTGPFDAVISLADAAVALPLEAEVRQWREVVDDIRSLGTDDATLVLLVENDLGTHRISSLRNPRSADEDSDWSPSATWDESRPRSLAQVEQIFDGATVHCLWPTPHAVALLADATIDSGLHAALAFEAAAGPLHGPDPAWLISAFARGGLLADVAPAWLVAVGAQDSPPVERVSHGELVAGPTEPVTGRSALDVFAELAADEDLPEIRQFIKAWAEATTGSDGTTAVDASFGLCVAEKEDAAWRITPLTTVSERPARDEQWRALAHLVGVIRDRAWRTPWPSTSGYPRILNHLGIMAGLHTVSTARAERLIPAAPPADAYSGVDHQQLVAKIEQQEYSIHTLRSKLAWTQLQLDQALERDAVKPLAIARATKHKATRVGRQGLGSVKALVKRVIG